MRIACIIPVPAEPEPIREFRRENIRVDGPEFPMHTTILGPVEVESVDMGAFSRAAARCPAFDYCAHSICGFPTTRVLWLSPTPQAPFEALTEAVYQELPHLRPRPTGYPTFHMTIAYNRDSDISKELADAFSDQLGKLLPLELRGKTLEVFKESGNTWELVQSFPLADPSDRRA
jgi:2'-5' RNA ligase